MRILASDSAVTIVLLLMTSAAAHETKAADLKKSPTPEQRLQAFEGKWRGTDTSIVGGIVPPGGYPKLIVAMADKHAAVTVVGNVLTVAGEKESAALAIDLDVVDALAEKASNVDAKQKLAEGERLLMLTLPSGRGILARSSVKDGKLRFDYPWDSISWRTGVVIELERVKE